MSDAKQYIFQVTKKDLEDIFRAANPENGTGISIVRKNGSFSFNIDEAQFKRMIWVFYHKGGFTASLNDIDSISLDPER